MRSALIAFWIAIFFITIYLAWSWTARGNDLRYKNTLEDLTNRVLGCEKQVKVMKNEFEDYKKGYR